MKEFDDLVDIISRLRKECPWDREQTHESLAKHLIEEAYELLDALAAIQTNPENHNMLNEELGDLLLQILLHAKIAEEKPSREQPQSPPSSAWLSYVPSGSRPAHYIYRVTGLRPSAIYTRWGRVLAHRHYMPLCTTYILRI